MAEKKSSTNSVEKALILYDRLLFSSRRYSVEELMSLLNCSKSTVSRIIQQIENRRGTQLRRDVVDGKEYYSLEAPARRPRLICREEEFEDLQNCIDTAGSSITPARREELKSLVGRMRLLFAGPCDVISSVLEPPTKDWMDCSAMSGQLRTLLDAIDGKKLCRAVYQKGKRAPQSWILAPVCLFVSDSAIYVSAWHIPDSVSLNEATLTAKDPSERPRPCFVCLHRLKTVDCLHVGHTLPMELPDHRHFGRMTGEPFRVKVHFEPEVADWVEDRRLSSDQKSVAFSDGSLEIEFSACNRDEVVSWLLGFGSSVKILEPDSLIARYKKEMAAMLSRFRGIAVYEPDPMKEI